MTAPERLVTLAACEAQIEAAQGRALAAAVDAGEALGIVRDQRLYAEAYPSFDAYCRDRWDMRREQADSLIRVAIAGTAVRGAGLPLGTSQRALLALAPIADDPDRVAEVWGRALEGTDRPTAPQVAALLGEGQTRAFGDRPYAAELADPEGWRTVAGAALAEWRATRERGTLTIPATTEGMVSALVAHGIEADAIVAEVAASLVGLGDGVASSEHLIGMVDDWSSSVWEASEPAFAAWPPLSDFWPAAHEHGWFNVPAFVGERLAHLGEGDDGWTSRRAVAVLGLLAEADQ